MEVHSVSESVESIAAAIADEMRFEVVHVDVVGAKRNPTVRIFIDKVGGVTVEDCAEFSRRVETGLDSDDLIPSAYVLEVSSPGIERQLYKLSDFEKFAGQAVRVKTNAELDGRKSFRGTIVGTENGSAIIASGTETLTIPFESIAKANLLIDLGKEFGRRGAV